jgi:uncharacterized protein (UPF0212 family)
MFYVEYLHLHVGFNVEHYIHLSFQSDCSLVGFDVSMEVFNVEHYLHLSFQYECSLVGFDVSMQVFNVEHYIHLSFHNHTEN